MSTKGKGKRLPKDRVQLLEKAFKENPDRCKPELEDLAELLELDFKQVKNYFRNKKVRAGKMAIRDANRVRGKKKGAENDAPSPKVTGCTDSGMSHSQPATYEGNGQMHQSFQINNNTLISQANQFPGSNEEGGQAMITTGAGGANAPGMTHSQPATYEGNDQMNIFSYNNINTFSSQSNQFPSLNETSWGHAMVNIGAGGNNSPGVNFQLPDASTAFIMPESSHRIYDIPGGSASALPGPSQWTDERLDGSGLQVVQPHARSDGMTGLERPGFVNESGSSFSFLAELNSDDDIGMYNF